MKAEAVLMECIKYFQLSDLIGLGTLLHVKEQDDFEEYVVDIVTVFSALDRRHKRELLKLAKQIKKANGDLYKAEEKDFT